MQRSPRHLINFPNKASDGQCAASFPESIFPAVAMAAAATGIDRLLFQRFSLPPPPPLLTLHPRTRNYAHCFSFKKFFNHLDTYLEEKKRTKSLSPWFVRPYQPTIHACLCRVFEKPSGFITTRIAVYEDQSGPPDPSLRLFRTKVAKMMLQPPCVTVLGPFMAVRAL